MPVIRLHDLRHTNASLALSAGVDLKVVSERLGHSQLAITADLYTHVNRGLGKAAAEQIARALMPASPTVPTAALQQGPKTYPQEGGDTESHTLKNTATTCVCAGQEPDGRPSYSEPTGGLEPPTPCLQDRCAANCATSANRRRRVCSASHGTAKSYLSRTTPERRFEWRRDTRWRLIAKMAR
jgi:hypothetical protein